MFIEKDSPQNVSLHDFTITEKTEKGEAFGSPKFINSYTSKKDGGPSAAVVAPCCPRHDWNNERPFSALTLP